MLEKIDSSVAGLPCVQYKLNGVFHKTNGPAMTVTSASSNLLYLWEAWYLYGNNHRYYGDSNSVGDWFIHGVKLKW
jgi:uncharacterized protein YodC (DUF2158 family)